MNRADVGEVSVEGDHPLILVGITLLLVAVTNYLAYDRFVLSYVLAEQCVHCEGPAMVPGPLAWSSFTAVIIVYVMVLLRSSSRKRQSIWHVVTFCSLLIAAAALTFAHHQAIFGASRRWAAVSSVPPIALGTGIFLVIVTAAHVGLAQQRKRLLVGAPALVMLAAVSWTVLAAKLWFRNDVTYPFAKAALLLAGSIDVIRWWVVSLAVLATAGLTATLLALWRARSKRSWAVGTCGLAALCLSIPYALDALKPLPLHEAVPQGLSIVATCINERFSDAIPLEAIAARPIPATTVGYLAEALDSPTPPLVPRLRAALDAGVRTVVVPAKRKRTIATYTVGPVTYDEVCLAGKFELTASLEAPTTSEFATLADLIRSAKWIRPQ